MPFDLKIFHDYDIRGIYPTEINESIYTLIGQALAKYVKIGPIAVGHDMRISSPSLSRALIEGITSLGIDVVDLGLISTEMLYFACGKYDYPLSCIVSASHNPPEYNGLKGVLRGMIALNGSYGFPEIKEIIAKQFSDKTPRGWQAGVATQAMTPPMVKESRKIGTVTTKNILTDWISHLLSFVDEKFLKPLKVVVDAGNGMAGITWQNLMAKLPIEIIPLYFEPDGTFPHHIPNPLEESNLKDIKKKIRQENADCGFAFDGDADRFFILDGKGEVLSGTITTAILASHLLQKHGPASILYNAICGRIVPETIKKYHGTPYRVRVGHSFIKQYMRQFDGLFAGEHSGHYYFKYNHYADSSAIAALLFLEYVSKVGKKVSDMRLEFDKYPQSGELNFLAPNIDEILNTIRTNQSKKATSIDEIDGLSIWYPTWWFNMRASKTEPLLRLNIEADNKTILQEKKTQLIDKLLTLGAKLK
ncbi:phosphomannomutase/phosphoglucomutase [Candidatus Gottesmanbacteria bacterium]|nr:phosphomannomutase/phosphoglucomutase [Candidatus Gottesmanbacteria bacterium]